jgi:hypothetical protein
MPPNLTDRNEPARCTIVHERLELLREESREINQRLDKFATGMLEKMKGDTQLAFRVEQMQALVISLDELLVRGSVGRSALKAEIENLRREMDHVQGVINQIATSFTEMKRETEASFVEVRRDDAAVEVAYITAKSSNWKNTAMLLGLAITSLAGLIVSILK